MSKPVRRQGSAIYYARRAIPKDLLQTYGKREIWKSLGTPDLETAKPLEQRQQLVWHEEFQSVRLKLKEAAKAANSSPRMTPAQAAEWERQREEWERENNEYWAAHPFPDYDDLTPEEQRIQDAVEAAREGWEKGKRDELKWFAQERLAEKAADPAEPPKAVPGRTPLRVLVQTWSQTQKNQKTIDRMGQVVAWFEQDMGRLPVEEITADDVLDWSEKLLRRASQNNARTKLANFRTLLQYAWTKARLITSNPAAGVTIEAANDPEDDVQPFDLPALKAIFGSPIYAADERPKGGAGEAAYWLPLLALYTGARLNELGQLRPSDILQLPYTDKAGKEHDVWCIRIVADRAEGLKLKNKSSARRLPVHHELVRLGFLEHVAAAREAGQSRIFPELRPDKYGTVTANWSKWFGRYLRDKMKVGNDRMRFHSFRHAFKDYAREAEIPEDVNDAFTGHKGQAVARKYGSSLNYPLRPLVTAIAEYRVTGLKLPAPPPAFRAKGAV